MPAARGRQVGGRRAPAFRGAWGPACPSTPGPARALHTRHVRPPKPARGGRGAHHGPQARVERVDALQDDHPALGHLHGAVAHAPALLEVVDGHLGGAEGGWVGGVAQVGSAASPAARGPGAPLPPCLTTPAPPNTATPAHPNSSSPPPKPPPPGQAPPANLRGPPLLQVPDVGQQRVVVGDARVCTPASRGRGGEEGGQGGGGSLSCREQGGAPAWRGAASGLLRHPLVAERHPQQRQRQRQQLAQQSLPRPAAGLPPLTAPFHTTHRMHARTQAHRPTHPPTAHRQSCRR